MGRGLQELEWIMLLCYRKDSVVVGVHYPRPCVYFRGQTAGVTKLIPVCNGELYALHRNKQQSCGDSDTNTAAISRVTHFSP